MKRLLLTLALLITVSCDHACAMDIEACKEACRQMDHYSVQDGCVCVK